MKQSHRFDGDYDIIHKKVAKDGRIYLAEYKNRKCTVIVWPQQINDKGGKIKS